jgi:hypothetical protein
VRVKEFEIAWLSFPTVDKASKFWSAHPRVGCRTLILRHCPTVHDKMSEGTGTEWAANSGRADLCLTYPVSYGISAHASGYLEPLNFNACIVIL